MIAAALLDPDPASGEIHLASDEPMTPGLAHGVVAPLRQKNNSQITLVVRLHSV